MSAYIILNSMALHHDYNILMKTGDCIMAFSENDILLKTSSNVLWHFFYIRGEGLKYRIHPEHGDWSAAEVIAKEVLKDFTLHIDYKDKLHLIYQTRNGELRYMRFNGHEWSNQVLTSYDPSEYMIRYPSIAVMEKKVHVVFAINTILNCGVWVLYHYYWNGEIWNTYEICTINGEKHISPFQIDITNSNLHLCYRTYNEQHGRIYYTSFAEDQNGWSTPDIITAGSQDYNFPTILAYSDSYIHFAFTSLIHSNLHVQYVKKSTHQKRNIQMKEQVLSVSNSNCTYPIIMSIEKKLWILWLQNEQIMGAYSENSGDSWNSPKIIDSNDKKQIHLYAYFTNRRQEKDYFKSTYIFGVIQPNLSILIVNQNEKNDIVKTKPPATITPKENDSENSSCKEYYLKPSIYGLPEDVTITSHDEPQNASYAVQVEDKNDVDSTPKPANKDIDALLHEMNEISILKQRLKILIEGIAKEPTTDNQLNILDSRMEKYSEFAHTIDIQIQNNYKILQAAENELQQISILMKELQKEYLDITTNIKHMKEKNVLKKIFSFFEK